MSAVHAIATLLPGPVELHAHLRALAVLETAIADDPQYCYYTFDATWGPGEEAALMENGSGDDFSVLFTPAGVLIRGFDHESAMSPYGTDDEQVWPGVIDEVPAALRPLLDEPAFCDEGIDAPRVTVCLWRETGDTAWRTGSGIDFPPGGEDPDGSGFLFHLLADRSPEAVQAHFEDYYERSVPLEAVRHVLAGHPLTPAVATALNPATLADNALLGRIDAHPETASYLARDGEFDLARTDPIEPIALPNGLQVEPVAGCNAGGTYYLCGPAVPGAPRPLHRLRGEGLADRRVAGRDPDPRRHPPALARRTGGLPPPDPQFRLPRRPPGPPRDPRPSPRHPSALPGHRARRLGPPPRRCRPHRPRRLPPTRSRR
ncbi:hypothetical protein [Streptomyces sp. AC154]|uniref:hypothetical protein n=1 Tax=Streptomyces sp. AC154 TaxID=3143184 RepID=UPI003F7E61B0